MIRAALTSACITMITTTTTITILSMMTHTLYSLAPKGGEAWGKAVVAVSPPSSPIAKGDARFEAKWLIIAVAAVIIAWLALVPLGFLLWQSFMTPISAAQAARFTFENYKNVYGNADTFRLLSNSIVF